MTKTAVRTLGTKGTPAGAGIPSTEGKQPTAGKQRIAVTPAISNRADDINSMNPTTAGRQQ